MPLPATSNDLPGRTPGAELHPFLDDSCPGRTPPAPCPSLATVLSLLHKMPALLWTTDAQGRFTSLAGAGLAATGTLPEAQLGRPAGTFFTGGGLPHAAGQAHARALLGQAASFETEVNGRDLQAHLEPLRGPGGDVSGIIGVALDLTGRLVAERALRLSELSYRSLIEEAPYAICRCTPGGQLLQVNRAMLTMLGYREDQEAELLERDLDEIFAGTYPSFRAALGGGETVRGVETAWLPRDGDLVRVVVSGRALHDPTGAISLLDILAEDVTAKRQLEEELAQAQKMQAVGQLAGGVAHDFNNLLTVIGGHLEMILDESTDDLQRARLTKIQQAADRAGKLTRQLLAYSRRQVLQTRVVNLNLVIKHLLGMLGRLVKENVALTFLPGGDLGWVHADPHQIEQVLINLTVNAQDAMPTGGRLTLETRNLHLAPGDATEGLAPGDYVQIIVTDTGYGMDRATQARAFEPFFTTKETGEGTGLGLSMAYGIITQSGGHLRLASEPGQGCTFWITLPRTAGPDLEAPSAGAKGAVPRGSETILLAEDEDELRDLVDTYLSGLGYEVLGAPDGLEALDLALEHPERIHLLLSDLVMPRCGGRELAAELRKARPGLKVIFFSGYPGEGQAGQSLALAEGRLLTKPTSLETLAQAVREVLDA